MNFPTIRMSHRGTMLALLMSLACAAHADAAKVNVDWTDAGQFSDTRQSMCRTRVKPQEWLGELARYVESRASRIIGADQELNITITDIRRAGICEPWRGPSFDDIRIIKDIYAPSVDLRWSLTTNAGTLVRKGEAKLRDPAFLQRGTLNSSDPLRYEKRLLDDWLRREFAR